MLWIIWTCGWWLAIGIVKYLSELQYKMRGVNPSIEARGVEDLILLAVWIIGMVKFWA